jgi:murein L,D-transpeptidase YafK
MRWITLALAALVVLALLYAHWPSRELPPSTQVDSVLVLKAARKLILMNGDAPIKEYRIALGGNPEGHKEQQGDSRTPEGVYSIDYRKPDSSFHRALHVSYPNATDEAHAAARGVDPGGLIMIHGTRNGLSMIGRFHRLTDWTDGCIAVTNKEIEEIWRLVPNGTPIEIRP